MLLAHENKPETGEAQLLGVPLRAPARKLVGQKLLDVRAAPEDALQVDPSPLHVHPQVKDDANLVQPVLGFLSAFVRF